jgi:hypothetical protein
VRRLGCLVVLTLLVFAVQAPRADAAFGFESLALGFTNEDSSPATQAGSHPYAWTAGFALNTSGDGSEEIPDGSLKDLRIQLPPGLVGTPGLLPHCAHAEFIGAGCPAASEVGELRLHTSDPRTEGESFPLYNLEPLPGNAAELAFTALSVPVIITMRFATAPPYNLIASIVNAPQVAAFFGSTLTIHGVPGGVPFLTLPRSCAPATAIIEADPWGEAGAWVSAPAPEPLIPTGCGALRFSPALTVGPTTAAAHAPSGLDFSLELPDEGLTSADGTASADLAAAELELPGGMTINPALAAGLGACSAAQLAAETLTSGPDEGCPQSAKIGTAAVTTPLLDGPITGDIFVATPDDPATGAPGAENPLDARFALYLVLRDPERGILLRLPMRIDADPAGGRLTATAAGLPQLPFTHLELHLNSGPRAPLTTPDGCGAHPISYSLAPSSGKPPVAGEEAFVTTSGCGDAFAPDLSAGTTSTAAGSSAPLVVELRNAAGGANLSGVRVTLPPGLAADLSAVATCPDADAAGGSCPAAARVGSARIALGTGSEPLWLPSGSQPGSDVYLAGAYRGAPYSLLVSVPAAAGPFDLGRVVLRAPLRLDPETGRLSVEVAELPQIRDGIPLHYRAIRLVLDRPGFVRNPTSCAPMQIAGMAGSTAGESTPLAQRFQVGGCGALPFEPHLALRLSGALGRNGHPALRATLRSSAGQADAAAATIALPPGELLDFRHLGALCQRRLPPERCPVGARRGHVRLYSPLLGAPLEGPIYLREPRHGLPDLLVDLRGDGIRLILRGHTATRGGRLRLSFPRLPDLPFSRAAIDLAGGRRGILVNSEDLCGRKRHGSVLLKGQNGKQRRALPALKLTGCADRHRRTPT